MSEKLPKKRQGYMTRGAKKMLHVDDKLMKEFPSRHVSSEEDLRTILNLYFDNVVTLEEYNSLLGQLEDITDMYEGLKGHCDDLEELLRQKDEEIEKLTKEQEKKPLKRLEKKPLKRLK